MKNCGWKIFKAPKFYFIADMLMTRFVYFTQNMTPLYFSTISTLDTPTSGLLWRIKEAHHKLPFLDVLVDNNNPNSFLTRVYRKKTFTALLTNYFSFTSYSYKAGLIRTLVDRAYKINNTWVGLHEDITKLIEILKKNLFPAHLIERVVNCYITGTLSNHCPRGSLPTSPIFYFKLPYIGHFSVVTQKKIRHFIKRYCNDLDIKLVFSSFKIGNMFGVKDPIPGGLRSRVVYKFACAGCNACYVGETGRHFSTRFYRILNIVAPYVQQIVSTS